MIFVNAFITVGASMVDDTGKSIIYLTNPNEKLNYEYQKQHAEFYMTDCSNSQNSSTAPADSQGCIPIKSTETDLPMSFEAVSMLPLMAAGVQIIMLNLATIFWPVAPILWAIAAVCTLIQLIAVAWVSSLLIRGILGRLS